MPKMKTHRGAAKRIRITANGKLKRSKANKSHILTKKDSKRRRHLDTETFISQGRREELHRDAPLRAPLTAELGSPRHLKPVFPVRPG